MEMTKYLFKCELTITDDDGDERVYAKGKPHEIPPHLALRLHQRGVIDIDKPILAIKKKTAKTSKK